jgi:hypothetical protein
VKGYIYFKPQMGVYPVAVALQEDNTQMHISQKITRQRKEKANSMQNYTNSEGHITANEYSIGKEKKRKRSLGLGGQLGCETSRFTYYLGSRFIVGG